MLGVVNLDKPVGPTSHDMVALVRRLTGMRRIGHAGTLDPLASGVLPILVGAATRFSEDLTRGRKRYEAVVRLGWRSATDDAEGALERGGPLPPADVATAAISAFNGTFPQRPPSFSARKVSGRVAHRAARAGAPVELAPRMVTVESIVLHELVVAADHLDLLLEIACGPGTYIRSIARDLGERLGCGGYLAGLRRTEAAGLRIEEATTPEALEALAADGDLSSALIPVGDLLGLPRVTLGATEAERFRHGATLELGGLAAGKGRRAVHDEFGRFMGVGRVAGSALHPEKVLDEVAAG